MSDRYWSVVCICFALASSQVFAQEQPKPDQAEQAQPTTGQPNRAPFPIVIIQTEDDTAHEREREQESDAHEAADLSAQDRAGSAAERSATATEGQLQPIWASVILSAAAAFLSASALIIGIWTQRSVNKTSRAELRAYVQVDISGIEIITPTELKIVTLQRNTGATPAYKVAGAIRQFYCPLPVTEEHLRSMIAQVSREAMTQSEITIGPDSSRTYYRHEKPIADRLFSAHSAALEGQMAITVCGFVSYDDTFKKRHTTQFLHVYTLVDGKWTGTYAGGGNNAD